MDERLSSAAACEGFGTCRKPVLPLRPLRLCALCTLYASHTREEGAFVLQRGSYTGIEAHPGCGRTRSKKRMHVCLESGCPGTAAIIANARRLSCVVVRPTGAAPH